jgi:hypothetical protein
LVILERADVTDVRADDLSVDGTEGNPRPFNGDDFRLRLKVHRTNLYHGTYLETLLHIPCLVEAARHHHRVQLTVFTMNLEGECNCFVYLLLGETVAGHPLGDFCHHLVICGGNVEPVYYPP